MCVAKTKALISFTATAKLICVFVRNFAYAKIRFSHDAAHMKNHLHVSQFQWICIMAAISKSLLISNISI